MSISPVGNSDAYARYRQQALDLLASPSQSGTQVAQTTAPSYVTPPDTTDASTSSSFGAKFKADLTALNAPQSGASHTHGAHGHHHKGGADTNTASQTTNPADPTAATTATDPFDQALDDFANVVKTAVGIAAIVA